MYQKKQGEQLLIGRVSAELDGWCSMTAGNVRENAISCNRENVLTFSDLLGAVFVFTGRRVRLANADTAAATPMTRHQARF